MSLRKLLALVAVLATVISAILYLENPPWLQALFGHRAEETLGPLPYNDANLRVGIEEGFIAPNFALKNLEGKIVKLTELRGQKILLNFWATWCAPCKVEMPDLEAQYQKHHSNLIVLGIDLDESADVIQRFLKEEVHVSYPIVMDTGAKVKKVYNVFAQPTSYFINEKGVIVDRKFGAFTTEELEERVNRFLENTSYDDQRPENEPTLALAEGDLSTKYFDEFELSKLNLKLDSTQVRHLLDLDRTQLVNVCNLECISSIDVPSFESPEKASEWLQATDLVIGLILHGKARAYPLKILNFHEIVNEELNGTAFAVTFCPLCNSSIVFERPSVAGKPTEFGVSGRLYRSDLVMYDRATGSFWSQIEGRAIVGPQAGHKLRRIPSETVTWQSWRSQHPETQVLARPTKSTPIGNHSILANNPISVRERDTRGDFLHNYTIDHYEIYRIAQYDTYGTPYRDERLKPKDTVIGVRIKESAKAYLPQAVRAAKLINDTVGAVPVLILWDTRSERVRAFERQLPTSEVLEFTLQDEHLLDKKTGSLWTIDGQGQTGPLRGAQLAEIVTIPAYWFAWVAFYPQTGLFAK
ncbi:DUF3179 domain-containing protein [Candidatus Acetothermia bacterium]|nr:DUF3179 domain-containing protein [Candidatus Acetothermia bacterium]